MKINLKKSISVLLMLCLMFALAIPVSAVPGNAGSDVGAKKLNAVFEEAKFTDVGLNFYSRELGFENSVAVTSDETGRFGLVDRQGTAVVPHQYQDIHMMEKGLYSVQTVVNNQIKTGAINARGEFLVPLKQDQQVCMRNGILKHSPYSQGYEVSAYMHPDGTSATRGEFDTSSDYSYNGYKYYFDESGQKGVLDPQGKVFIQAGEYSYISIRTNGPVTMFCTTKKLPEDTYLDQYWNTDHQEIISNENYDMIYSSRIRTERYDSDTPEGDWYFVALKGDQAAVFDHYGKMMIPFGNYEAYGTNQFGYAGAEGYFYAVKSNKDSCTSYIYHNGELIRTLADVYLAESQIPGTVGYQKSNTARFYHFMDGLLDLEGNTVISTNHPLDFHRYSQGVNGQIIVSTYQDGQDEYSPQLAYVDVYDPDFKCIPALRHDSVELGGDRWYQVSDKINGQDVFGLCDSKGNMIVPQEYKNISLCGPHMAILEKDSKYSLMNDQSQTIIPPTSNILIVPGHTMADWPSQQDVQYLQDMVANYVRYNHAEYVEDMQYKGLPYNSVIPVVTNSGTWENPIFHTFYVNLETGEAEGYLDCLASAIDDQGRFAYRAENGRMGFAVLAPEIVSEPQLWVTGGQVDAQNDAVVRIVLDNQQTMNSGKFQLNYDSTACTVTKAESLVPDGKVISDTTAGQVLFQWTPEGAEYSQALLEIHFRATAQSPLKLEAVSLIKDDGTSADVRIHHGSILPTFIQLQNPSAENTEISKNSGGRLSVKADVALAAGTMSMCSTDMDVTVVAAPYQNGRMSLAGLKVKTYQVHFDENGLAQFPVELTCRNDTEFVKVFLLSADGKLTPFTNTADIPIHLQPLG